MSVLHSIFSKSLLEYRFYFVNKGNIMARVTVEDCLTNIHNRFDLILVASKRARQVARGVAEPMVSPEHDKPTVIALREIAEGLVTRDILNQPERENPKFERMELNLSSGHGF